MENAKKYYENTKSALPHINVKKIIDLEKTTGQAIDLGCGAGRDTIFLVKNNWKVLSIDKEDTEKIIAENLNKEELKKFKFNCGDFENINLIKNNLIVANFSLPFCNKNYFSEVWNKIVQSIQKNGYFIGNFFGLNDSWANIKEQMVFLSKEQIQELFVLFDIIEFEEIEEDSKTALGKMKHWHIYDVIAKKK